MVGLKGSMGYLGLGKRIVRTGAIMALQEAVASATAWLKFQFWVDASCSAVALRLLCMQNPVSNQF